MGRRLVDQVVEAGIPAQFGMDVDPVLPRANLVQLQQRIALVIDIQIILADFEIQVPVLMHPRHQARQETGF